MNKQQKKPQITKLKPTKQNINPKKPKSKSSPAPPSSSTTSLKQFEQKKKTIFKPILTNPYTKQNTWPIITPDLASGLQDMLCESILNEIGKYNTLTATERKKLNIKQPESAKYVTSGFNSVTSKLEKQSRRIQAQGLSNIENDPNTVVALFVCKLDLTNPIMYAHFPMLAALSHVKLIQLPRNSSKRLQTALGLSTKVTILCLSKGLFMDSIPGGSVSGSRKALGDILKSSVPDAETPGFMRGVGFADSVKFLLTEQNISVNKGTKKKTK
ncbi:hypothetical protein CANARDRAFT_5462 [[Candida] arabinofermentans NRRL YB-2248]|uniref:Uncharacterized protein n=1 Tax=[Candida] arabinofermentans NRRL YB-2248 TaxID=983967 RepID=A0A1E4T8W9_9ASCO|nr:hypothetical protein CANARDRAFT_5462 [[Candida] arabinofermentans NRRL YB-2248]